MNESFHKEEIEILKHQLVTPSKGYTFDNVLGELYDNYELKTVEQLDEFFEDAVMSDYLMNSLITVWSGLRSTKYSTSKIQNIIADYKEYVSNIINYITLNK